MNNIKIYGKKRNQYLLNESEIRFLNEQARSFQSGNRFNPNILNKLKKILDKISSLSFIQENIYQIFDGLNLKNSESMQRLYNDFEFQSMINNPNRLNDYIFNNKINNSNKNVLSEKSYINHTNKNFKSKLGKSVLIFFFILKKMVSYIKNKKADFDILIESGRINNISKVNQEKLAQAIKSYKGFEYLMNKFLKLREKIFNITQLEYVEEAIPVGERINVDYHLFKPIIDGIIRYKFNEKTNINYVDFYNTYILSGKIIFNNKGIKAINNDNTYNTFEFIYNDNSLLEIEISNPNKKIIINSAKSIFSIFYSKKMNDMKELYTIISKRNKLYYIFQYVIDNKAKIIKSYKPKHFVLDINKLNNNNYGTLIVIMYYK